MAKKKISPEARAVLEDVRRELRQMIELLRTKLDAMQRD
jgi:hypothetical protein